MHGRRGCVGVLTKVNGSLELGRLGPSMEEGLLQFVTRIAGVACMVESQHFNASKYQQAFNIQQFCSRKCFAAHLSQIADGLPDSGGGRTKEGGDECVTVFIADGAWGLQVQRVSSGQAPVESALALYHKQHLPEIAGVQFPLRR